jgi:hypothetical protein
MILQTITYADIFPYKFHADAPRSGGRTPLLILEPTRPIPSTTVNRENDDPSNPGFASCATITFAGNICMSVVMVRKNPETAATAVSFIPRLSVRPDVIRRGNRAAGTVAHVSCPNSGLSFAF